MGTYRLLDFISYCSHPHVDRFVVSRPCWLFKILPKLSLSTPGLFLQLFSRLARGDSLPHFIQTTFLSFFSVLHLLFVYCIIFIIYCIILSNISNKIFENILFKCLFIWINLYENRAFFFFVLPGALPGAQKELIKSWLSEAQEV